MRGDPAVEPLGHGGEARNVLVGPQHPCVAWHVRQRAQDSVRRTERFTIWQDQLNGALEIFAGDSGKALGDFLIRRVLNLPAGKLLPKPDPDAAEAAVTVEDQE